MSSPPRSRTIRAGWSRQTINRRFPAGSETTSSRNAWNGFPPENPVQMNGLDTWPAAGISPAGLAAPGRLQPPAGLPLKSAGAFGQPLTPAESFAAGSSSSGILPASLSSHGSAAELDRVIAAMEQQLATLKPGTTPQLQQVYLRQHAQLRLLYLIAGRQERALAAIPAAEPADQEFWQQTLWGLSNYFDDAQIPDARDRAAQTVTQLQVAVRKLQEKAGLELRNPCFCRQIAYFGNYERFPKDEFRPGEGVLVYAEVENFRSEPTADGQHRTLLRSTIDLLSPSGEVRKHIDFPATEDLCRVHRRDYFHNYQFTIPDKMPLGPHTLKLTVFDEISGKMASTSINFLIK